MPFIVPRQRRRFLSSSFSQYANLEETKYFLLQKRKKDPPPDKAAIAAANVPAAIPLSAAALGAGGAVPVAGSAGSAAAAAPQPPGGAVATSSGGSPPGGPATSPPVPAGSAGAAALPGAAANAAPLSAAGGSAGSAGGAAASAAGEGGMPWPPPPVLSPKEIKRLEDKKKADENKSKAAAAAKLKERPKFRILTTGPIGHYEVAYGQDYETIRKREWTYLLQQLPLIMPPNLKDMRAWVIAQVTTLAKEEPNPTLVVAPLNGAANTPAGLASPAAVAANVKQPDGKQSAAAYPLPVAAPTPVGAPPGAVIQPRHHSSASMTSIPAGALPLGKGVGGGPGGYGSDGDAPADLDAVNFASGGSAAAMRRASAPATDLHLAQAALANSNHANGGGGPGGSTDYNPAHLAGVATPAGIALGTATANHSIAHGHHAPHNGSPTLSATPGVAPSGGPLLPGAYRNSDSPVAPDAKGNAAAGLNINTHTPALGAIPVVAAGGGGSLPGSPGGQLNPRAASTVPALGFGGVGSGAQVSPPTSNDAHAPAPGLLGAQPRRPSKEVLVPGGGVMTPSASPAMTPASGAHMQLSKHPMIPLPAGKAPARPPKPAGARTSMIGLGSGQIYLDGSASVPSTPAHLISATPLGAQPMSPVPTASVSNVSTPIRNGAPGSNGAAGAGPMNAALAMSGGPRRSRKSLSGQPSSHTRSKSANHQSSDSDDDQRSYNASSRAQSDADSKAGSPPLSPAVFQDAAPEPASPGMLPFPPRQLSGGLERVAAPLSNHGLGSNPMAAAGAAAGTVATDRPQHRSSQPVSSNAGGGVTTDMKLLHPSAHQTHQSGATDTFDFRRFLAAFEKMNETQRQSQMQMLAFTELRVREVKAEQAALDADDEEEEAEAAAAAPPAGASAAAPPLSVRIGGSKMLIGAVAGSNVGLLILRHSPAMAFLLFLLVLDFALFCFVFKRDPFSFELLVRGPSPPGEEEAAPAPAPAARSPYKRRAARRRARAAAATVAPSAYDASALSPTLLASTLSARPNSAPSSTGGSGGSAAQPPRAARPPQSMLQHLHMSSAGASAGKLPSIAASPSAPVPTANGLTPHGASRSPVLPRIVSTGDGEEKDDLHEAPTGAVESATTASAGKSATAAMALDSKSTLAPPPAKSGAATAAPLSAGPGAAAAASTAAPTATPAATTTAGPAASALSAAAAAAATAAATVTIAAGGEGCAPNPIVEMFPPNPLVMLAANKVIPGSTMPYWAGRTPQGTVSRSPGTYVSWSHSDAGKWCRVRQKGYAYSKKKDLTEQSFFECVSVDVFRSDAKITHVAKHLQLPEVKADLVPGIKSLLVISLSLPEYAPTNPLKLFTKSVVDGPGFLLACVFRLTPYGIQQLNSATSGPAKLLKQFLSSADGDPIRDRLKAIPNLVNAEEMDLGSTKKGMVKKYNQTPWMTKPQHTFTRGDTYFEMAMDVHTYCYPARQALSMFLPQMSTLVIDMAWVVESRAETELPEQIICSVRLANIDPNKAEPLHNVVKTHQTAAAAVRSATATAAADTKTRA